jgi:stage IV sporulation protein FB
MIEIPGKIPIRIFPFFWLLALIIGWLNSFTDAASLTTALTKTALWVGVITISIIVHEFGHALSALAFGQKAKIDLVGFGGLTQRSGPKLKLWKEFVIVLCGPVFGFCLALLAFFILNKIGERPMNMGRYVLEITFYVNAFWTLVNLLPVQPLDGGRLLSIFLEGIFGVKGIKAAYFLSIVIAALVGLLFFAMQAVLAGSLFLILAFESYRSWQGSLTMQEQDQNQDAQALFKKAEEDLHAGRKNEAYDKLRHVRDMTQSGLLYLMATHYEAILLNDRGDYKTAYEILHPLKNKLDPAALPLLQLLAYRNQDYREAIQIGNSIFREDPHAETAFINALCYAALGEAKPAVGWLDSALREGLPHTEAALDKKEFDAIRQSPEFQDFIKRSK